MNWFEYVGKRVLITRKLTGYALEEAIVVEVSPSGEYVCFDFSPQGGAKRVWRRADEYKLIEVLDGGE